MSGARWAVRSVLSCDDRAPAHSSWGGFVTMLGAVACWCIDAGGGTGLPMRGCAHRNRRGVGCGCRAAAAGVERLCCGGGLCGVVLGAGVLNLADDEGPNRLADGELRGLLPMQGRSWSNRLQGQWRNLRDPALPVASVRSIAGRGGRVLTDHDVGRSRRPRPFVLCSKEVEGGLRPHPSVDLDRKGGDSGHRGTAPQRLL